MPNKLIWFQVDGNNYILAKYIKIQDGHQPPFGILFSILFCLS